MKKKENHNVDDAIDFMFDGGQSDLSGLSSDEEENDEIEDAVRNNVSDDEQTHAAESDNDIPLASLAGTSNQTSTNNQSQANNEPAQRVYCWGKRDSIVRDNSFLEEFSEPPLEDMTPLQWVLKFITTALLDIDVEQTNINSFQSIHEFISTSHTEIMYLIGVSIKIGILQLPFYKFYWSQEFRCPRIADLTAHNCYQELHRYLHFVSNDSINAQDKLAKIRPLGVNGTRRVCEGRT